MHVRGIFGNTRPHILTSREVMQQRSRHEFFRHFVGRGGTPVLLSGHDIGSSRTILLGKRMRSCAVTALRYTLDANPKVIEQHAGTYVSYVSTRVLGKLVHRTAQMLPPVCDGAVLSV